MKARPFTMIMTIRFACLAVLVLVLGACTGGTSPTQTTTTFPTTTATPTHAPTSTPSPTQEPSPTPKPTATITPSPVPTATPLPGTEIPSEVKSIWH
jgi:hypothetical protein